jgi:hypothetical protein
MKIVSAAEMREIDRATSERFGVPSLALMENAGSAVARFILSDYPNAQRIGVICGKGLTLAAWCVSCCCAVPRNSAGMLPPCFKGLVFFR